MNRTVYWTQLSATVSPGDNTLTVVAETDWVVGDEIVVATTSYEAWQTETFIIVAVTDASTFQINGTFEFRHVGKFEMSFGGKQFIYFGFTLDHHTKIIYY